MTTVRLIADASQIYKGIDKQINKIRKIRNTNKAIAEIFISSFVQQVAPHSRSGRLQKSFLKNYKVFHVGLKYTQTGILEKSKLAKYWDIIDKGSANAMVKGNRPWLWMKHPKTGKPGRWIPGDDEGRGKGDKFTHFADEKVDGMWVSKHIKGINWIKYGIKDGKRKVIQFLRAITRS